MAAIKIEKFLGIAPRISPELLPNTAGQIANGCKLYSGDLIPYPQSVVINNAQRTGELKTLFVLRNPENPSDIKWLSWNTEVDIARLATDEDNEQRFYFTGDGLPKVSNYNLATNGAQPYPSNSYELGLPLPEDSQKLSTSSTTFTTKNSSSFARDAGNIATIITSSNHGLRTGNTITISGFPVGTDSAATFNATSIECTVVNDTTISYFSPGEQRSTTSNTDGRVDLGGLTQIRSYVFTWYTPWEEESIASLPSDNLFIKEGTTVTVTDIPTASPAGNYFIRGVNLYRTLPSASGTEYFLLQTLWFPSTVSKVERTGNVSRVTMADYHNLGIDDRFKISGCTVASFNITGGVVTDVIDKYTFEYEQTDSDVVSTSAAGTLYHDVSENDDKPARYWGDGSYSFIDDFDSRTLLTILDSDEYDPPPDNLQGLVVMQNQTYVGFVGNQLYFSEPNKPHAWPRKYIRNIEHNIVGLAALGGFLLVMTESYPYQVVGSDPNVMSVTRIDAQYPCLSKRSIVSMSYGIIYSTHDGLAVYSPTSGPVIITRVLFNKDTWGEQLDPASIIGMFYGDTYFASHTNGSIIFERDDKVGGMFVTCDCAFSAAYYDSITGYAYFARGDNGDIYRWDDLNQPNVTQEWKSKVIITKDFKNLVAARDKPDYKNLTYERDNTTTNWGDTDQLWNNSDQITFKLWVDKELIFTTTLNDGGVFRLPSGYRTDTFEVGIEGNVRIRAIHLGETPTGLRTA